MKIVLKEVANFLAFLMFITSCYTYKEVQLSHKDQIKEKDHLTIEAKEKKYKHAKVRSVTDSTIVLIDNGKRYNVKNDDITSIMLGIKDQENTTLAIIAGSVIFIGVVFLVYAGSHLKGL